MSSQTIRLCLTIRRHGVPDLKLAWACTTLDDLLVSGLLEQINEVIPLESADWGLEDYAVELFGGKRDSYELLHFQQVSNILKEEDEVLIRALSTNDLRRRRLNGRRQISTDGKHLIDGLAFGRPWLKVPRDRPSLDLPPRKRARITREEELDENDDSYADEEDQSEQLLLEGSQSQTVDEPGSVRVRARFLDIDPTVDLEDEDEDLDSYDREFLPIRRPEEEEPMMYNEDETSEDDEPDVDLSEELRLLNEDNALVEQTPPVEEQSLLSGDDSQNPQALLPLQHPQGSFPLQHPQAGLPVQSSQAQLPSQNRQNLLALHSATLSLLDQITALRAAFPLSPITSIQSEVLSQNGDLWAAFEALKESNDPAISFDEVMDRALIGGLDHNPLQPPGEQSPMMEGFGNQELQLPGHTRPANSARPLIEEIEAAEDPVRNLIGKVEDEPISTSRPLISVVQDDTDTSSSSDSESESESESDSESDSDDESDDDLEDSSSESDSDNDSDGPPIDPSQMRGTGFSDRRPPYDDDATTTSSSEDSDSSSDSDSNSDANEAAVAVNHSTGHDSDESSDSSSDSSSDDDSSSSDDSESDSEPEEVSSKPGARAETSPTSHVPAVPEPSAEAKAPDSASQSIEEPSKPGSGLTRTKKRNARRRDAKRLKAFQALEDTPSQSSINENPSENAELLARKRALLSVVSDEPEDEALAAPVEIAPEEANGTKATAKANETPVSEAPQEAVSSAEPTSAQRRLKVDMGAGRRLLFGALGLKNPKSKADEAKLRKTLMKDVKPLENPCVQGDDHEVNGVEAAVEQSDEDPDAWRASISYRGVECCHDGMMLGEPPFPFVQRWDPQQQYGSMRKRKRSSQNFYDESYYDEDSQWNGNEAEWDDNSQKKKKSKKRKSKGRNDEEESSNSPFGARPENDDADVVLNYDDVPTKARPESSQFTDMDDLPSLPSDLGTLPSLDFSEIKPGMVITWKQLLLSKATNWQPEIASVTGLILSISEDSSLHVLLAKRDREQDDREYDEHTGKRVYAKFEAPDLEEDDDTEDDGRREIPWGEMMEPKLVQQAPSPTMLETPANGTEPPAELNTTEENAPRENGEPTSDNKVSKRQDRDETMAEELDTQEVRAEVEADLREREAARRAAEHDKSTSIPSGQMPPRLELTASGDDTPISTLVRPADTSSDMTNSPSRQLQETIHAAMVREQLPLSHNSEGMAEEKAEKTGDEKVDDAAEAMDINMEESGPGVEEPLLDAVIPDSIPSPELPPLPSKESIPIDHRTLAVPSSVGSIRSGRQPPSNSGLEDLPEERVEDSVVAETTPRPRERTPSPQSSPKVSSPFPSLEEIFHTAVTSRQTQSPGRSTQQSVLRSLKPGRGDLEYEEAMRKLDEGEEESDRSPDRNKSIRSLFPNATQPEPSESLPKLRSPKIGSPQVDAPKAEAPTTPPKSQKVKRESPFVIPEGSQVIELSSSPPSVEFTEHYAQDSEDETYEDSPLPRGSGWVQKKVSNVRTRSRGKSLPAATASSNANSRARLPRGRTSLPPARDVTASAFSQIKGRRKSTRKF
ncbi:hypothetical protein FALBO_4818 [Fusarium albosuccineum]|uniref:DUF7357 domain-containing protein n=1 Tax=Fusarium albosuccineum TaxID=1237068 RepID=A0A8H4LGE1_9HYPO|nr:hypothetical protein FALBO_4818 [Fusarium albosuccineum]